MEVIGQGVEPEPVATLAGKRVTAFCGIGNPDAFRRTIEPLCGTVAGFKVFPDHHGYTAADVRELTEWVKTLGADLALTTQKDSVKLRAANLGRDAPPRAADRAGCL